MSEETKYPTWDDELGMWEFEGGNYDTLWECFWYGVFKFCGCGNPEDFTKDILEFLKWSGSEGDAKYKSEKFPSGCYTSDYYFLMGYLCDAARLTEHGSGLGWAWLTDKGRKWVDLLEKEASEAKQ